jgi:hypothetical protein
MDEKAIGSTADCADDALSRPPRSQCGDDDDGYQREHHHQFAEPATWYWRVVSVEHLGPSSLHGIDIGPARSGLCELLHRRFWRKGSQARHVGGMGGRKGPGRKSTPLRGV